MRLYWMGEIGYPDEATRDATLADFTAGVEKWSRYLTPAVWEDAPNPIPAGITSPTTVNGLPGFSFGFDILDGWQNSQQWADLSDTAQGPAEAGGQSIMTLAS